MNSLELAVLASIVVLAALLLLLHWRNRRADKSGQSKLQREQQRQSVELEFVTAAETAMLDLKSSVEGLAACLANLELRMSTVDQRQRKFDEMANQIARRRGFDEALQLVRDGKPASDVARMCAIPLAEAQLLSRIHQASGPATGRH